ncbi:tetratricopeptide repeat protein [Anaerolineales bacterium HSG25]|nr:tetratricopeptide repeat protein [Anaerolineales bacterium HSG25]
MNITLTNELGKGGEATVYNLAEQPNLVAKIYHTPTPAHEAKLRAMLMNPPDPPRTRDHVAIAWPTALLYQQDSQLHAVNTPNELDSSDAEPVILPFGGLRPPLGSELKFVGFLMPKVRDGRAIFNMYNPALRKNLPYPFDWRALHRTAYNLCTAVLAIHAKGYVIGDINESNILVNRKALVTIVDCDSFQVTDEQGTVHRCHVGKPEYTPPELQGVKFREVDQTIEHDLFGLGVLLFQLLMGGFHPFAGVLQSGVSVGRVDLFAIRKNLFPYNNNPAMLPPPSAPPFEWLYPELQTGFFNSFVEGHADPHQRLSASLWRKQLYHAEQSLHRCKKNRGHVYSGHHQTCPYCERIASQTSQTDGATELWVQPFIEGITAYENRDTLTVIDTMTKVLARNGAASGAFTYRAWAFYQEGDYQPAINDAQAALKLNTENVLAHFTLGQCYYEQGAYKKAITAFSQAIEHGYEPASKAYQYRAKANQRLLQPIDMARDLAASFAQDVKHSVLQALGQITPDNTKRQKLLYSQGVEAYKKKDAKTVIQVMSVIIKNGKGTVETYTYRGWGYAQQQQYASALNDYLKALKQASDNINNPTLLLNPPSPNVYELIYDYGKRAYRQKDVQAVFETMNALVSFEDQVHQEETPGLETAISLKHLSNAYRGWAYYQQGDYEAAQADALKAISHRGFNAPALAYHVLGASYSQQKAYHKAFFPMLITYFIEDKPREAHWEQSLVFEKFGLFSLSKKTLNNYLMVENDSAKREQAQKQLMKLDNLSKESLPDRIVWIIEQWRR